MRLFTAVYPSPESLTHLDGALGGVGGEAVADPGTGLRWVPREQRHVTLAFHGEVPDGAVDGYVAALGDAVAGVRPFDLALAGSGTFSGRTLWVGVGDDVDALRSLARRVDDAADEAGVPGTDRVAGRPHLTVARASASVVGADRARERRRRRRGEPEVEPSSPFGWWSRALSVYRGPAWRVDEVLVVSSRLGEGRGGGPAHEVVARVPLPGHLD